MDDAEKINILIVDDLPEKLLVLESILEELGENVIKANSGAEALRLVLAHDFAVILLDVYMPGMNGFETAALIRQRRKSAHTPIIFITAFADEMHTAQGYSMGAVDYILSPIVPEILRTKVKVFVDLYRMTQQVKQQADERVALAREQAARAAAEDATRRSTFLAEASKVLSSSLDHEATQRGLLRLSVPYLGDLTALTLADDHARARQTELAWSDAVYGTCTLSIANPQGLHERLSEGIRRVLELGKLEYVPDLPPGTPILSGECEPVETSAAEANVSRSEINGLPHPVFDLRALLHIPLLARGRALGVLTLAMGPSGRRYSSADLALAEDLAGRAAIALDNARLYRNVQEADRHKNEFLSMLAHELRNPLAPIRNAVQLLRLRGAKEPEAAALHEMIDRQVMQLVRLVDDLLDLSRITRGKIHLQMEYVEVGSVVARAVETSRPLIDARKHELTVALPPEPLLVRGDPVRLAQILSNLLNNAAKYTEEGGRIQLLAERSNDTVTFHVRDNGVGIPPDMLSSIFELFTQVDRSLDRSQGGLGIGLTLVHKLVEMHGGRVEAFSEGPNQGSELVVHLPLEGAEPAAMAVSPVLSGGTGVSPVGGTGISPIGHRRVLIVDDNADAARSLAMLLEIGGHETRLCYDGQTGLAEAEAFRPEVVLLDIGLPELDGLEVARRLRALELSPRPMLVALTGYGQADDVRRSQEAGFDHHLVKPADPQTLTALLACLPQPSLVGSEQ
ncbi:MAG TPA: response regulator [Gemmataceae bacterium]|nr:response regulator [Gemmataceae bacterium]